MPSPIRMNSTVMSRASSTGVRKRMMLAAPAMPNARASELPMMIIISAPDDTQQHLGLLERRIGRAIRLVVALHDGHDHADDRRDDELRQLEERRLLGRGADPPLGRRTAFGPVVVDAARRPPVTGRQHQAARRSATTDDAVSDAEPGERRGARDA